MGDHRLHVVFNGSEPSAENLALFDGLDIESHRHDNTGWDIGAFQTAALEIDCDLIVCLGTNSHFKRAGWLRRMIESVEAHGDGLYGSSASYERDPHIRTTAFWCDPMLIRAYPKPVRTFDDRYEFEASPSSITRLAEHVGLGCWFVTWDGEYPKPEWRTPPNIFRRGDQSNSLVFDRYFEVFDALDSGDATGPRLRRGFLGGRRALARSGQLRPRRQSSPLKLPEGLWSLRPGAPAPGFGARASRARNGDARPSRPAAR